MSKWDIAVSSLYKNHFQTYDFLKAHHKKWRRILFPIFLVGGCEELHECVILLIDKLFNLIVEQVINIDCSCLKWSRLHKSALFNMNSLQEIRITLMWILCLFAFFHFKWRKSSISLHNFKKAQKQNIILTTYWLLLDSMQLNFIFSVDSFEVYFPCNVNKHLWSFLQFLCSLILTNAMKELKFNEKLLQNFVYK